MATITSSEGEAAMTSMNFVTYRDELLRRPLQLERAEDILDAVLADASLSHAQREELVWYFHRRAFWDLKDARSTFLEWRREYRELFHPGCTTE
jgi:hypothetical protein